MNFLHFILLVLLGFLSPSLAAVARQTTCVPGTGKINQDLGHSQTMGVEPADHLDLPLLLLAYGLKCTEIPNQKPKYQGNRRVYLNDNYCATWFDCQPDGSKLQFRPIHKNVCYRQQKQELVDWCNENCECVLVDRPVLHFSWNYGCPNPYGGLIEGNYGAVARDVDSAEPPDDKYSDDGLVMEAFDGPPLKE